MAVWGTLLPNRRLPHITPTSSEEPLSRMEPMPVGAWHVHKAWFGGGCPNVVVMLLQGEVTFAYELRFVNAVSSLLHSGMLFQRPRMTC